MRSGLGGATVAGGTNNNGWSRLDNSASANVMVISNLLLKSQLLLLKAYIRPAIRM